MAGLDQALSGLASGQLQAIVAAAQSKLQADPATGSTSVDVAVHDTKILFPTVFPMLPDMSDGRFTHPDSALDMGRARVWVADRHYHEIPLQTIGLHLETEAGRCYVDRSDRVSVGDNSTIIFRLAGLEGCQHRIGHQWKNDV